jgi:hypothetical protein
LSGISDEGGKKVDSEPLVDHHRSSDSSSSSCQLFWLEKPLGQEICGCLIGKQSVVRFCISAVSEGTNTCSKVSHSIKSIKAEVVPQAWYVTTAVPGRGGGRAALSQKSIQRSQIPKEFWETLDSQSKEPSEWETLFANARLAQRVGISNLPKTEVKDEQPDLTTYYTPVKKRDTSRSLTSSDDSWVIQDEPSPRESLVDLDGSGLQGPGSAEGKLLVSMRLNSVVQENFEKVGRALDSQKESLAGSLEAIQVRMNTLGLVVSSVDRRVGKPSGFGAEFGVSSAFDGLRHLIENLDEFQEPFGEVPYSKTLLRLDSLEVARLAQESKPDLEAGLATTDEALRNLKTSFKTSIDTLKTRCLNPLMNFYTKCHQPGKDIFGRLAQLDERLHELSNDGNAFGSMKFLGGFGSGVPSEADSLTRFTA